MDDVPLVDWRGTNGLQGGVLLSIGGFGMAL